MDKIGEGSLLSKLLAKLEARLEEAIPPVKDMLNELNTRSNIRKIQARVKLRFEDEGNWAGDQLKKAKNLLGSDSSDTGA